MAISFQLCSFLAPIKLQEFQNPLVSLDNFGLFLLFRLGFSFSGPHAASYVPSIFKGRREGWLATQLPKVCSFILGLCMSLQVDGTP